MGTDKWGVISPMGGDGVCGGKNIDTAVGGGRDLINRGLGTDDRVIASG